MKAHARAIEVEQILARNPAGKIHRAGQAQRIAQFVQRAAREAVQAARHQPELRPAAVEFRECAQQAVQVLVRMEGRDRQQKWLGRAAPADGEKLRAHAVRRYPHFRIRQAVAAPQVRRGGAGNRQDQPRNMRRPEQEEIPEGTVEPAEVLRVALVLEVVEHGDLRAGAGQRRREAGVEERVQAQPRGGQRQRGLFPQNARGPRYGVHRLRDRAEVGLPGNQVRAGLAVGEDEVAVAGVDLRQRGQQAAQINLRAAHPAGDQVQRVDAQAQRPHVKASRPGGPGPAPGRAALPRNGRRSPGRARTAGWLPRAGR